MSHICDRAIEISLRVDVRFGPESEQDRVATQYVAMGQKATLLRSPGEHAAAAIRKFLAMLQPPKKLYSVLILRAAG
jgi:hypothetical protein